MLAGYLRPSSGGTLDVLGLAPTAVDALRGKLGVLPQDALLPPSDPVGEFLVHMAPPPGTAAGARPSRPRRRALAEVAGADWWTQRCGRLSHGMAKRVALAQAFLGDAGGRAPRRADGGTRPARRLGGAPDHPRRSARHCTIVVSSHNLQELEEVCDGAAILDRGRVVAADR